MTNPAPATALSISNTFGVAAGATRCVTLDDPGRLADIDFDPSRDLVLGDGSNVLLTGDIPGAVLLNRMSGRQIQEDDGQRVRLRLGAGEPWHDAVRWTVDQGLAGLENLSLIPGRSGAAPLQNIGAYGVELADCLVSVEAWDWHERRLRRLDRSECGFSYRDSRFKSGEPDRFLITSLSLDLQRHFEPRLDYAGLREELEAMAVEHPTPRNVSDAVVRLRRRKLPDPGTVGNAGSFFKNPLVDDATAGRLRQTYPDLPLHPAGKGHWKTSAAWLIERCGWKGHRRGDAGVSDRHALVLVNHGSATGSQLLDLARDVRDSVEERFGIELDNEPRIIRFPQTPTPQEIS